LELPYIAISDKLYYLFLFGYACFMCSLYVFGLLSGFLWLFLRQNLAFLVKTMMTHAVKRALGPTRPSWKSVRVCK